MLAMVEFGHRHKYRPTKPYRMPTGELRVVVCVDEETYAQIDKLAKEANCSLSAQCRILIDCGIEEFLTASGENP
jgi:hypothetical protein